MEGNASTNFCLVGETENLDSSRCLHLRYGNGIAKAIVSHARTVVRVSPRKRMLVGMKFALRSGTRIEFTRARARNIDAAPLPNTVFSVPPPPPPVSRPPVVASFLLV